MVIEDLKNQKDEVSDITLQMARGMVDKVLRLYELKKKNLKLQRKKLREVENKYQKKLESIERDIYKFEDSIRNIVGQEGYRELKREYRIYLKAKREEKKKKEDES